VVFVREHREGHGCSLAQALHGLKRRDHYGDDLYPLIRDLLVVPLQLAELRIRCSAAHSWEEDDHDRALGEFFRQSH
jgi:hypothetical protein